jgi:polyhydroxybutyrate depolymerase
MEIHGAADTQAPYNGNPGARMAAVQDYLNAWLSRDQCTGASHVFFQQGDVTGIEWTHCAAGTSVRHYRVSDGGHTWPGTPNTTHVIDANVVIWDFFSHYSI